MFILVGGTIRAKDTVTGEVADGRPGGLPGLR